MSSLLLCCVILIVVTSVRCQTSSYTPCVCPIKDTVPRDCQCALSCDAKNFITTGTEDIIWKSGVTVSLARRCIQPGEKCCFVPDDNDSSEESGESTTSSGRRTSTTARSTDSGEITSDYDRETSTTTSKETITAENTTPKPDGKIEPPPPNTKGGCGVRRLIARDRIYSDNPDTAFGEFPWMVAVFNFSKTAKPKFNCGGSLISHEVVLTAAHCVHGKRESEIAVMAGDWDLNEKREPEPNIGKKVKKIIRHEDFDPRTLVNDVALLVLQSPLPNKIHIDTICLPEKGVSFAGEQCIVTGWGTGESVLKQVEVPILTRKNCRNMLRKTRFGRYFQLHKSFVCAGGEENRGACLRDGGGPLICASDSDPDRYYQVGIVAGGLACGVQDIPDLYADVSYFADWINDALRENNLDSEAIAP